MRKKSKKKTDEINTAAAVATDRKYFYQGFSNSYYIYDEIRKNVPVADGAVKLIVKTAIDYGIESGDEKQLIETFLKKTKVNGIGTGFDSFLSVHLSSLLTYGVGAGQMALDKNGNLCLYNLDVKKLDFSYSNGELAVSDRRIYPPKNIPESSLLISVMTGADGSEFHSALESIPFVSSSLYQIFSSVMTNWKRVGDIRYFISIGSDENLRPDVIKSRAQAVASAWKDAMRSEEPKDFVTTGNVDIKTIGADGSIPESKDDIKQLSEQILAGIGVPPFMLGLENASTETMTANQLKVFSGQLRFYRKLIEPAAEKAIDTYLRINGFHPEYKIIWKESLLNDTKV